MMIRLVEYFVLKIQDTKAHQTEGPPRQTNQESSIKVKQITERFRD